MDTKLKSFVTDIVALVPTQSAIMAPSVKPGTVLVDQYTRGDDAVIVEILLEESAYAVPQ